MKFLLFGLLCFLLGFAGGVLLIQAVIGETEPIVVYRLLKGEADRSERSWAAGSVSADEEAEIGALEQITAENDDGSIITITFLADGSSDEREMQAKEIGLNLDRILNMETVGLSENLVLTEEARIKYRLTREQVAEVNQYFVTKLGELEEYQRENVTIERVGDAKIQARIPPYPDDRDLETELLEDLERLVDSDIAGGIFYGSQANLVQSFHGLGKWDRVITFSSLSSDKIAIEDVYTNAVGMEVMSIWSTTADLPAEYQHFLKMVEE
ncbi:MAG: hypothetical protein AAFX93_06155 [Verrucomicrobiota bacterium]